VNLHRMEEIETRLFDKFYTVESDNFARLG
jgi:hypothetical protein